MHFNIQARSVQRYKIKYYKMLLQYKNNMNWNHLLKNSRILVVLCVWKQLDFTWEKILKIVIEFDYC